MTRGTAGTSTASNSTSVTDCGWTASRLGEQRPVAAVGVPSSADSPSPRPRTRPGCARGPAPGSCRLPGAGRALDLDEELLAGHDVGRALADQRLDGAAAADDPPLGGGLRQRHGHIGLALLVGHHGRRPEAGLRQFLPRRLGARLPRIPLRPGRPAAGLSPSQLAGSRRRGRASADLRASVWRRDAGRPRLPPAAAPADAAGLGLGSAAAAPVPRDAAPPAGRAALGRGVRFRWPRPASSPLRSAAPAARLPRGTPWARRGSRRRRRSRTSCRRGTRRAAGRRPGRTPGCCGVASGNIASSASSTNARLSSAFDRPVQLVRHGQRHLGLLAGLVRVLVALQRHLQFPLHSEALASAVRSSRPSIAAAAMVKFGKCSWPTCSSIGLKSFLQVHQPVVQDLLALEGQQRQRAVQARVQADGGLVADLQRRACRRRTAA